ncbi:MAG: TetR/AcrR family transcriptional regulator [Oscillospiraceae bacterium]
MIKSTFYNLPEEKKCRLILAAKKEFIRVSYNEASINKIIKDAGISRGSFYTYFDDKSDLARCLMDEYFKTIGIQIKDALKQGNGDIFAMFTQLFDITIEYTELKNDMELFHSLFRCMHSSSESEGPIIYDKEVKNKHLDYIMGMINREKLNVSSDDDLKDLLELLFIVTKQSLAKIFLKNATKEVAKQSFLNKINILKNGVLKL